MKKMIFISFTTLALIVLIGTTNMCQAQQFDNTRINSDIGTSAQYNESVAINHQDPENAVIVWQDMRSGYPRVAIAYTFDGGQSWTDYLLDLPAYPTLTDPSVAVDTDGNFFACMVAGDTSGQVPTDIIILRSTDGGISWSNPMVAVPGSPDYHDIMPKIAVDNTPFGSGGFIYVAWVRYTDDISSSLVFCTQSGDHGQLFLDPVQVSNFPGALYPNLTIRTAFENG
ncbi:MAG TPA: hypothetical protein DCZ43_03465, partial [candidate division Zixibacteria bacterium]|nr:hypothetical protein [candidate division Zixibacteria bacterium]